MELNSKFLKCCGVVSRYRNIFPFKLKKDALIIYFTPTCNIVLWHYTNATKTSLNKLLITQKRFMRILYNLKYRSSVQPYFKKAKIIPIGNLSKYRLFKIFKSRSSGPTQTRLITLARLNRTHSHYNIRTPQTYIMPRISREYSWQKLAYVLPKFLNKTDLTQDITQEIYNY